MNELWSIPEIRALSDATQLIRIPDQLDVPITGRITRLLNTAPMQRLQRLRQLGLVSQVYPGANHSRWEHSLGVYRACLFFLRQLATNERFQKLMDTATAEALIVAALMHDIGHWPYCHPIEDLQLPEIVPHEQLAARAILESEIGNCLDEDWRLDPARVLQLLNGEADDLAGRLASSILSGPIDIDKLDYLYRDSYHCGVPYGRNFDAPRLISSLTLNGAADGIALTSKGRTAAEMMVFSRYVMFSEVYWHHAVRSATAMVQRAFFGLLPRLDLAQVQRFDDDQFHRALLELSAGRPESELVAGVFGVHRRLYKRWATFSSFDAPEIYAAIARKPYPWIVRCSDCVSQILSRRLNKAIQPHEILLDAPPLGVEVQFQVEILNSKTDAYQSLAESSPVVSALAQRQFDDFVKQVRLFVSPRLQHQIGNLPANEILTAAINDSGC